ncbi:MAG: hypothetical protein JNJ80_20650 [Gemmatimonadetes bacterium]|nr:hypothetical protein [Gemmatimonadota bacterium]MCC7134340.1 hypothetical protein [Gemmatimonadales bacterium]
MKKSRLTEPQMVGVRQEGDAGIPVSDLLRETWDLSSDVRHVAVPTKH